MKSKLMARSGIGVPSVTVGLVLTLPPNTLPSLSKVPHKDLQPPTLLW